MSTHGHEEFFTAPNEIELTTLPGPLAELIERLARRGASGQRTLLPARSSQRTRWYAFAPNTREARILWEELRSWLGGPISDRIFHLGSSSNPLDARALSWFDGWNVIAIDVVAGWETVASEHVGDLCDLWALSPDRSVDLPRPVGRVLRQFYEAVLAGVRADAESALEELRARALINPTNLRFLRVEMLSALATAEELRDDPPLAGITRLARPAAVTQRLAQAANALYIEPTLAQEPPNWQGVAELVERAWPGLAVEAHQVTDLLTARCFALAHTQDPAAHRAVLSELLTKYAEDPVLRALIHVDPDEQPQEPGPELSPLELYDVGSYERALGLAETLEATRSLATVALACAVNLGNAMAAARALAIYHSLPIDVREAMKGSAVEAAFVAQLEGLTSHQSLPLDWMDWLRNDWPDRPDLLNDWSHNWSSPASAEHGTGVALEIMDALHDSRRDRVRNGLPVLIDAILSAPPQPARVALMVVLFDVVLSSEPGRLERQASLVLLDECLSQGCSRSEYSDLLGVISRQMQHLGPREASWLLQTLDLLLLHGAPDPTERTALIGTAYPLLLGWSDRMDPLDRALSAKLIGLALGHAEALTIDEDPAQLEIGRVPTSVGIYSLMEGAAGQAAKWIKEMWPAVEVRLSSAHVNTEGLTALVRGVDVMLVQTSHAKHAATQAVEAAVQEPDRLVRVSGRGATSLLRALIAWSESPAPAAAL